MRVAESRPLAVLLILGTLAGCKEPPPPPPPPPEVVVQPVDVRDTPVQAEFTGEIRGGEDVEVRARVAGYLQSENYDEGTVVRKGQLLFVIDPKPFEATVARARADMAEAQALHNRAEIQVNRLTAAGGRQRGKPAGPRQCRGLRGSQPGRHGRRPGAAHVGRARPELHQGDQSRSPAWPATARWTWGRTSAARSRRCSPSCPRSTRCDSISPSPRPTTWPTRGRRRRGPASAAARVPSSSWFSPTDRSTRTKGRITVVGRGVDAETGTLPLQATLPQSRRAPPARSVRPGPASRHHTQERHPDPAAGGAGAARDLQRVRRRERQRRPDPRHQAREPRRQRLGHHRWPRAGRPGRGRRDCRRCATASRSDPLPPRPRRRHHRRSVTHG